MDNAIEFVNPEDYHWISNLANTSEDHLYFLFYQDSIKIGRAKNVEKRMKQLKTSFSKSFEYYVFENKGFMEKVLHDCFSVFRLNGEWFENHSRFSKFMKRYLDGIFDIPEYLDENRMTIDFWKMERGKYRGYTIAQIYRDEPRYLKFILAWSGDIKYYDSFYDATFFFKVGKIEIPEAISVYINSLIKHTKYL